MGPLLKHLVDELFAFIDVGKELGISGEFLVLEEIGLKFLHAKVHDVDIWLGGADFAPGELGHVADDVFVDRVQFLVGTFLVGTFAQLALALLFFFVVLLDLSLELKLKALCDLWANLCQDLFHLVLSGELALFELILQVCAFPSEVFETAPCH